MADLSVTRLAPEIPKKPAAPLVRVKLLAKAVPPAFIMVRVPTVAPTAAVVETIKLLILIIAFPGKKRASLYECKSQLSISVILRTIPIVDPAAARSPVAQKVDVSSQSTISLD